MSGTFRQNLPAVAGISPHLWENILKGVFVSGSRLGRRRFARVRVPGALFCFIIVSYWGLSLPAGAADEKIIYHINPVGKAVYTDKGQVSLNGEQVRMATFETSVMGFHDTETIYFSPQTLLPLRVDRRVKWLLKRESIIEEYDQAHHRLTIRKFKGKRLIAENIVNKDIPIYNAVVFPFLLREIPDMAVGWSRRVAFPNEFEIKLVSVDEIKVPAGRFKAYHFTSQPHRFEIWVSQDEDRVPVMVQGTGSFVGYTMKLYRYIPSRRE